MRNRAGYQRDVALAAEWITGDYDVDRHVENAAEAIAADYGVSIDTATTAIIRAIAARDAR